MSERESEKNEEVEVEAEIVETEAKVEVEAKPSEVSEEGDGVVPEQEVGGGRPVSTDEVGPEESEKEVVEEDEDPLEKAKEENKKIREQMLRLAADFDNFRKRARKENEEGARRAKMEVLRELLPVFDNMERAVAHASQATEVGAVVTGVEMVVKHFLDTIGKIGVERVKALGESFDPNVHEAIQQVESAEQPAGTVMAELLPGYLMGDRLLRASMVVVAKAPAPVEISDETDPSDANGREESPSEIVFDEEKVEPPEENPEENPEEKPEETPEDEHEETEEIKGAEEKGS